MRLVAESKVSSAIANAEEIINDIDIDLGQLTLDDEKTKDDGQKTTDDDQKTTDDDLSTSIKHLQEERAALDVSRKLLEELRLKASEEAVAQAKRKLFPYNATVTFGGNNSGFQAGVVHGGVQNMTFGGR